MGMTKDAIYNALDPAWWTQSTGSWNTTFLSTQINFDTPGTAGCTYTSSAPIQTGGLNSSPVDAPSTELAATTDILRLEAAQRLYDLHASTITGHTDLTSVCYATG